MPPPALPLTLVPCRARVRSSPRTAPGPGSQTDASRPPPHRSRSWGRKPRQQTVKHTVLGSLRVHHSTVRNHLTFRAGAHDPRRSRVDAPFTKKVPDMNYLLHTDLRAAGPDLPDRPDPAPRWSGEQSMGLDCRSRHQTPQGEVSGRRGCPAPCSFAWGGRSAGV